MKIHIIKSLRCLAAYEESWDQLSLKNARSAFQMSGWVIPWFSVFGDHRRLYCVLVFERKRLIALAPLMIVNVSGERILQFIGSPLNDYNGFLCRLGLMEHIVYGIFKRLASEGDDWDQFEMSLVEDLECVLGMARDLENIGIRVRLLNSENAPITKLPSECDDFHTHFSKRQVQTCEYLRRRLWRSGPCEFCVCDKPDEIRHHMIEFDRQRLDMWRRRQRLEELPRIIRTRRFSCFLRTIADRLSRTNGLRFAYIRRGREKIASGVYLCAESRITAYMFAWDFNLAHLSPGTILHWLMIKWSIENGFTVLDWGRGNEQYKFYRFGAQPRHLKNIILTNTRS